MPGKPKVLITGVNGFVGATVASLLVAEGYAVRGTVRQVQPGINLPHVDIFEVGDLRHTPDWSRALKQVDVVVHLAARVHIMRDLAPDPLIEFRRVNVEGTRRLAETASKAGVRRFIFMSSVKAMGQERPMPYRESDPPNPTDPYGVSKLEAERTACEIGEKSGMEVVIMRPPMVYGPGVKGNFLALLKLVNLGVPLPLKNVRNSRSLVYLENLADAIKMCIEHPYAGGKTYLVSDGENLSTPELVHHISRELGKPTRLIPCPKALLELGGCILGKAPMIRRITGTLAVDSSKITRELSWKPPYTILQGIALTARWFKSLHSNM